MEFRRRLEPFWTRDKWSLYLVGGTGSRKTSIALAIGRKWQEVGRPWGGCMVFVPPHVFGDACRVSDIGKVRLRQWYTAPLVIIDDLAAVRATEAVKEATIGLIEARYNDRRATIITSNVSLADLAQIVDPRVASRLSEGLHLDTGSKDWRLS